MILSLYHPRPDQLPQSHSIAFDGKDDLGDQDALCLSGSDHRMLRPKKKPHAHTVRKHRNHSGRKSVLNRNDFGQGQEFCNHSVPPSHGGTNATLGPLYGITWDFLSQDKLTEANGNSVSEVVPSGVSAAHRGVWLSSLSVRLIPRVIRDSAVGHRCGGGVVSCVQPSAIRMPWLPKSAASFVLGLTDLSAHRLPAWPRRFGLSKLPLTWLPSPEKTNAPRPAGFPGNLSRRLSSLRRLSSKSRGAISPVSIFGSILAGAFALGTSLLLVTVIGVHVEASAPEPMQAPQVIKIQSRLFERGH